ncbi:MAG: MATE family efflux transporter [Oscillospiraceae bacterium]|jgi:putative MATE family efflux protein|nr:MATE family efflux transporter [Oscillospiraceae bacterium]
MQQDLTQGKIGSGLVRFALPLMAGNLLQQFYNVADTWIVGRFLGAEALAAVGSAYTLMVFLTSILLGLSMGSGAVFSIYYGRREEGALRCSLVISFLLIGGAALLLTAGAFAGADGILQLLQAPKEVAPLMGGYLRVVYAGIIASFLYNYFASLLRALGNSVVPLVFLGVSAVLNVVLDLVFVLVVPWGVEGAALATVIAQYVSGLGIGVYTLARFSGLRPQRRDVRWDAQIAKEIGSLSVLTCVQQSIMNFGILMVQGRVNSFGPQVMAAFAAGVKIDSFAYMPVQDFGNAFSTFTAQNYGAGKRERIEQGIRTALLWVAVFCAVISVGVYLFAPRLMGIFVAAEETEIIRIGARYLRIEGACYLGIGLLFLLYGLYRAVKRPGMSVVLTVLSLGTRVLLAYTLSALPAVGVTGIWVSVPIGWFLADAVGIAYFLRRREKLLE